MRQVMKNKGRFIIGILVIVVALTFIGPGNVGATHCYDLHYQNSFYTPCSGVKEIEQWPSYKMALHKDKTWEAAFVSAYFGFQASGTWDTFGNAVGFSTDTRYSNSSDIFKYGWPFFVGTKTGSVKFVADPYKSKANIAKAQGFFRVTTLSGYEVDYCWALRRVKVKECDWISEGQ